MEADHKLPKFFLAWRFSEENFDSSREIKLFKLPIQVFFLSLASTKWPNLESWWPPQLREQKSQSHLS